jgi:predicted permease
MLGHDIWMTRFGGDPGVIGRTITVDDTPHQIVGVLPQGFALPKLSHFYALEVAVERPEIWKPFAATERDLRPLGSYSHIAIARLKPGVSAAQASDDINAVQRELARQAPEPATFRATLVPLADQIVSRSRMALQLLLAAVALVLLIACVNITNLLLARSGRRRREFSIRRAAGADQWRLLRQLLVESLVLSLAAGIAGLAIASALVGVIQANAPVDVPRIDEAALDWRALVFTFSVTLISGVLIGLVPAWRAARTNAAELLRASSAAAAGTAAAGRLRATLVSVEVAASAVCLIAAALLLSSFLNLLSIDRGFATDRIVTVDLALFPPRYDTEAGLRFITSLAERAQALPGVTSAGLTDQMPLSGTSGSAIMVEGTSLPRPQRPSAMIRFADPGYFTTMGIAARAGRLLEERDRDVAVISTRTAERLWPNQDPIGKRFRHGPDDSPWVEVVGVVGDSRSVALAEEPPLLIYRPAPDYFYGLAALAVKTTADPAAVGPALQRLVRDMDPQLAVPTPRTMEDIVAASVAQRRFQMYVMALLAAAAAFLAGLGIYGVVSQGVAQRTGEFGVRIALGARPGTIHRLVLRGAMLPVMTGVAAGVMAALGLGRLLRSLLFGVSPTDATPVVTAAVFLLAVALLATLVPARRATRVNPIQALRDQ